MSMIRKRDLAGMGQAGGATTPPPIEAKEEKVVYSISLPWWAVTAGIGFLIGRLLPRR